MDESVDETALAVAALDDFDFADFDDLDLDVDFPSVYGSTGAAFSGFAAVSSAFGAGFSTGLSSAGIGSGSARATLAEQARAIAIPSRRFTKKV